MAGRREFEYYEEQYCYKDYERCESEIDEFEEEVNAGFVPEVEDFVPEPEPVYTPEPEPVYTPEPEPAIHETVAPEPEVIEEPLPEPTNELVPVYMRDDLPSIDFARFSSDLFIGIGKEEKEVKNTFKAVEETQSEKLNEGLKAEEEKLKEAEALLASLGIKL